MTLEAGGSIEIVFDELYQLELRVAEAIDENVRVYRLKEDTIQLPAIYNWGGTTRSRIPDLSVAADDFVIEATIAVRGGITEDAPALLRYVDVFREIVQPELVHGGLNGVQPLNGATRRAQINRFGFVSERFNETAVLGMQFDIGVELNQVLNRD